jgi:hypothetical protein
MTEQPAAQPPIQQPPAQPVPAGEPVTIQPADQAEREADDRDGADGDDNTAQREDGQDQMPEQVPSAAGQPPGAQVMDPPEGGPGDQSLAERQAAGEQAAAGVDQPEAGPGGSSPYAEPAAVYPAEVTGTTQPRPNATSNESPRLPGNLTSGAARAHAALSTAGDVTSNGELSESDRISKLREIIDFALTELDRFLPNHVRGPAADEVNREL